MMKKSLFITYLFLLFPNEVHSMEETPYTPENHVPSLQKLCIKNIINTINSPEEVKRFAQGKCTYHLLPDHLNQRIAAKLKGRPRIYSEIDTHNINSGFAFHPVEKKLCLFINATGSIGVLNIDSGEQRQVTEDNNAFIHGHITCGADGKYFLIKSNQQARPFYLGNFNDFSLNNLEPCEEASFSPTAKELIIKKAAEDFSLLDIASHKKLYENSRTIQFCKKGRFLLIQDTNNYAHRIDTYTSAKSSKPFPPTAHQFILSPDGNEIYCSCAGYCNKYNYKNDYTRNGFLNTVNCTLSANKNKDLLAVGNNKFGLAHHGDTSCYFSTNNEQINFVLGGEYLLIHNRLQTNRTNILIKPEDVQKSESYRKLLSDLYQEGIRITMETNSTTVYHKPFVEIKIESAASLADCNEAIVLKGLITCGPNKHYIFYKKPFMDSASIYDIENQRASLWLTDIDKTCIFNPKGTMAFVPPCASNPTKKGRIIALDNDLTIQQFLLKQAIIRYHFKKDVVKNATITRDTYATLTDEQKQYLDTYIFDTDTSDVD